MPATLLSGFCAILIAAVKVSVGAVPPAELAIENSSPHGLPSPAVPPEELTQAAKMSARLLSLLFSAK